MAKENRHGGNEIQFNTSAMTCYDLGRTPVDDDDDVLVLKEGRKDSRSNYGPSL